MIKIGETLPQTEFQQLQDGKLIHICSSKFFSDKKVILFAVPGAFTPTCSEKHLPGFMQLLKQLQQKGIDAIACTSVNDVFVMKAWQQHTQTNEIHMLADGGAHFAKSIGMSLETNSFGGMRSKRYAMVISNNIVEHIFVEEPGKFEVSSAEKILEILS